MLDIDSGVQEPFAHFASDEPIVHSGTRVQEFVGDVDALLGGVNRSHAPAVAGVAGLLDLPMVQAEQPVRDATMRWGASAAFGGAAVVLFGGHVSTFNDAVDSLNSRYWSAKGNDFGVTAVDLPADATAAQTRQADSDHREAVATAGSRLLLELTAEHDTVHVPALDDGAAQVASLLERGPEDEAAVLELYAVGALPLAAPALFPGMNFASVPPPLNAEQGQHAAEVIQRALDGRATPAEFREAMALLQLVTDHARYVSEHGGTLNEDTVGFLHEFYNTLDERVFDVPAYIGDEDINWSGDRQDLMLAAMGTGLLALSNPAIWSPSIRNPNPMDRDSEYHLPPSLIDLVSNLASWRGGRFPNFSDVEAFHALADMLGATDGDVRGGTDFSIQLTLRATELSYGIGGTTDAWRDANDFEDSTVILPLLDVSLRNPEANHAILTGTYDLPVDTPTDGIGPWDLSRDSLLQRLYTFEWSDNGRTVAGLTSWIPEYAASGNPEHVDLAGGAADALIATVTDTRSSDAYGNRHNAWDHLMDVVGERNPHVIRGFGQVAAAYFTEFGATSPVNPNAETRWDDEDNELIIVNADKSRFIDLIATDDKAMRQLSYDAGVFTQRQLYEAFEAGERDDALQDAAGTAGRLDGLLFAARINGITIESSQDQQDANAAWQEHMYFANLGKSAFTTALGAPAGASPVTNLGVGILADQFLAEVLPAPGDDPPPADSVGDYAGVNRSISSYYYVRALVDAGQVSLTELRAVQPEDLTVVNHAQGYPVVELAPLHQLSPNELAAVIDVARDNGGLDYIDYYELTTEYDNAANENADDADEYREGGG